MADYRPQKCVSAEKVKLCSRCKALMTFRGFLDAQLPRGFVHSTVGDCVKNHGKNRSLTTSCGICSRIEASVVGDRERPPDSWLVIVKGQGSGDNGNVGTSPTGQRHEEFFGLHPLGGLIFGVQDPKDNEGLGFREMQLQLTLVADDSDPASAFIVRRPAVRDFTSPAAISAARAWVAECRSEHDECPGHLVPTLPSRVVDVGNGDDGDASTRDRNTLRLHVPQPGDRADYACLSYCWGGPQAVVATTKSLPALMGGFSLQSLGQTIQDAVEITRAMGTRYLWVDALCILQDDVDDKMAEIGKMRYIYKNSTYTIAAGIASTSTMGFLRTTDSDAQIQTSTDKSIHFQISLPDGRVGNVFLYFDVEDVLPERDPDPLNSRGWTLQEYLLPSRVLDFTRRQLLVGCQRDDLRQLRATNLYYDKSSSLRYQFSQTVRDHVKREHPWPRLIQEFTSRALTDPEDRLNAIEGIAADFAEQQGQSTGHAFGFQEPDFALQLAWFVRKPENTLARSRRAPTWSWASINGPVQYHSFSHVQVKAKLASALSPQSTVVSISGKVLRGLRGGGTRKPDTMWLDTRQDVPELASDNVLLLLLHIRIAPPIKPYFVAVMLVEASNAGETETTWRRVGLVEFSDRKAWADVEEETIFIV